MFNDYKQTIVEGNIIITMIINIYVDRLKRHRVLLNKVQINVMIKALNMIVDDWSLALNEKIWSVNQIDLRIDSM